MSAPSRPPPPVLVRFAPAGRALVPSRVLASDGPPAIRVDGLEKTYPNGTQAVRDVSFAVRRGEVFGILGPNGAGKSTLIGVLGTLVRPTAGRAFVDDIDVTRDSLAVRRRIGFAMQEAGVDDLATGREFLVLQARLYGIAKAEARKRAEALLALFELESAGDRRIRTYSGGMKRRIDLAAALIHRPTILFLDEPTEGLDPRSRRALWDTLERMNRDEGITILLSTHYMEEADHLCDRVAILDQGRIVAQDSPERLKLSVGGQAVVLDYPPGDERALAAAERALVAAGLKVRALTADAQLRVYAADAAAAAPRILKILDGAGAAPTSLHINQPTLDDAYLQYTGKKLVSDTGAKV